MYIENPKTKGSGIVTSIPQTGNCPIGCKDCFFQSGRSYLEPLVDNLPNIPEDVNGRIVRVNDGNDSSVDIETVLENSKDFKMKFYNTSLDTKLDRFDAPVVLTVNHAENTDSKAILLDSNKIPNNLMFVRLRVNTWNNELQDKVVEHYTNNNIPIVFTFMAYYDELSIPIGHKENYIHRKRTINSYYAITTEAWEKVMAKYKYNKWVYSCGKIEGEKGISSCRHCGNCIREYFATMEKIRTVV